MQKSVTAAAPAETSADSAPMMSDLGVRIRRSAEYIAVPMFALIVSAALFSVFLGLIGKSPTDFFSLLWRGGFGTAFSFQNTLQRAAPLILTALAMADELVAVGAADPVGLQRLVRGLQELDTVSAPTPTVVVNKVRAAAVGPRPKSSIADALSRFAGVNEQSFIPDDRDALDAALLTGRTLEEAAPSSPARVAIAELAARLVGIPTPTRRRGRRGTMDS